MTTELGTFRKAGADTQKLIEKIEYGEGPLSGGEIAATTIYVSTDWTNAVNVPTLQVPFTQEPGNQQAPLPAKPGMGMGR
ncbi:MAG: hypothetical protein Q8O05_08045 [Chloroflexota bacterium]|nr:hypothetical protein [Chloroflexota bacterium]